MNLQRGRILGIVVAATLTAGTMVLWSGAASAVTCPAVAPGTGTVTPAPTPGVDWSGCSLVRADLSGADLSGANLSETNLQGANLTGSNLSGANLTDSAIDNADLAQADLNGTLLTGIFTVVGVESGGITGTPASLPDTESPTYLIDGYLAGPDVNLDGADLASVNLAGIDFEDATFNGADLANANLTGASVDGDLAGTNLSGTDLTDAYLVGVSSGGITGTPSALPANWQLMDGYLFGPSAQVTQANLTGVNLAGADLSGINLSGTNLTDADMSGADLANAGLGLTTLTGANLSGADLANLTSWSITGTPAALPQNWTLRSGYLFGPQAGLYGMDLSGIDLSGLDLASANLQSSNLTGANLSGANFRSANLTAATIAGADLAGTVFAGTSLYAIRSGGGVTGTPASLPWGWVLRSGWLIGPSVFLEYGNLNGVNLSGADMAGAETDWSTFTGANLSGADLAGSFLTASDFTNADLDGADLFGSNLNSDTWTDATCPDGTSASSHSGSCTGALAFSFAGFTTPKPGSTVLVSAGHVSVVFNLATTTGAAIPASVGAAIGLADRVQATLAGPGITATTVYCPWQSYGGGFACTIADPHGIEKGTSHSYTITATEEPGTSFQTVPVLSNTANPETIHFG
jgi:uncharacterized protein YjbI with pentapeptide repeats